MIAVFAILAALPLAAQGRGPGGSGGRLDYLAGYLGLTDAQKTQAQAIFDAEKTAAETLSGQSEAARDALGAAVKAGAADGQIDTLSNAIGAVHAQLTAVHAKAQVKFRAILTAEQKAKLDAREGHGPGRQSSGGRMRSGRF